MVSLHLRMGLVLATKSTAERVAALRKREAALGRKRMEFYVTPYEKEMLVNRLAELRDKVS